CKRVGLHLEINTLVFDPNDGTAISSEHLIDRNMTHCVHYRRHSFQFDSKYDSIDHIIRASVQRVAICIERVCVAVTEYGLCRTRGFSAVRENGPPNGLGAFYGVTHKG